MACLIITVHCEVINNKTIIPKRSIRSTGKHKIRLSYLG